MANRQMLVPGIGEVTLAKRRGARNIRISITPAGRVRVALPHWTPYAAGLQFLKKHDAWVKEQLRKNDRSALADGTRIGRHHTVRFEAPNDSNSRVRIRVSRRAITVTTARNFEDPGLQQKLISAAERALRHEAEELLPARLERISREQKLPYGGLKIRKLTSRWGSCSSKRDITLSYFLVQLPDELVDYVLLHELAHTTHHNHSPEFWGFMEARVPNLRELRRQIKQHRPRVEPVEEA
jgi:predicted metal-dependent hydrolase